MTSSHAVSSCSYSTLRSTACVVAISRSSPRSPLRPIAVYPGPELAGQAMVAAPRASVAPGTTAQQLAHGGGMKLDEPSFAWPIRCSDWFASVQIDTCPTMDRHHNKSNQRFRYLREPLGRPSSRRVEPIVVGPQVAVRLHRCHEAAVGQQLDPLLPGEVVPVFFRRLGCAEVVLAIDIVVEPLTDPVISAERRPPLRIAPPAMRQAWYGRFFLRYAQ